MFVVSNRIVTIDRRTTLQRGVWFRSLRHRVALLSVRESLAHGLPFRVTHYVDVIGHRR